MTLSTELPPSSPQKNKDKLERLIRFRKKHTIISPVGLYFSKDPNKKREDTSNDNLNHLVSLYGEVFICLLMFKAFPDNSFQSVNNLICCRSFP